MAKKLFFLDIDGTLLNSKYKNNWPQLKGRIVQLQNQSNVVFCLNSNRAIEDLLPIAIKFGIQGPLICENGLFMHLQTPDTEVQLTRQKAFDDLKRVKEQFEKWLFEAQSEINRKIYYQKVDTVKLMNDKTSKFQEDSILVFDNKYRKYTISAHVRQFSKGALLNDLSSLKILREIISQKVKKFGLANSIAIDTSETFGNLLIYSKLTSKKSGVVYLIKNQYPRHKVIAIGDEVSDSNMVTGIGEFWTLRNASKDAKKNAVKISKFSFAKGVYDLLTAI